MKDSRRILAAAALAAVFVVPGLAGAQTPLPVAPPAAPAPAPPVKKEAERPPAAVRKVAKEALKPGEKAPDFTLMTMDGKEFKLSAHLEASKKPVVFIVGQSACTTCRAEVNFINAEAPKHAGIDFFLINVDAISGTDRGKEILTKYFESLSNKLPVLLDTKMAVPRQFGVRATPGMFIVGKDGTFVETNTGFGEDDGPEYAEKFLNLK